MKNGIEITNEFIEDTISLLYPEEVKLYIYICMKTLGADQPKALVKLQDMSNFMGYSNAETVKCLNGLLRCHAVMQFGKPTADGVQLAIGSTADLNLLKERKGLSYGN